MKSTAIFFISGLIIASFYCFSFIELQKIRETKRHQVSSATSIHIPPVLLKVIAGEFKGIFADYALLEAASIVGKKEKITQEEWDTVTSYYEQTIELDPYFEQSYHLINGTLPWNTERIDLTFLLIGKSKKHRFWDWVPGYFIGFDYFYFKKNNDKASEYLMEASQIKNAPVLLSTFAARLAQKSGKNQTAISFLKMVYEKETDDDNKDLILKRILAHSAVEELENGVQLFKDRYGEYPITLNALIDKKIMKELPKNPYMKSFIYDSFTGVVNF